MWWNEDKHFAVKVVTVVPLCSNLKPAKRTCYSLSGSGMDHGGRGSNFPIRWIRKINLSETESEQDAWKGKGSRSLALTRLEARRTTVKANSQSDWCIFVGFPWRNESITKDFSSEPAISLQTEQQRKSVFSTLLRHEQKTKTRSHFTRFASLRLAVQQCRKSPLDWTCTTCRQNDWSIQCGKKQLMWQPPPHTHTSTLYEWQWQISAWVLFCFTSTR